MTFVSGFIAGSVVTYLCYYWSRWSKRQLRNVERKGMKKHYAEWDWANQP